jgi:hypothetical protein
LVGRWVAKLVERLLAATALWVRIQASEKYKTGDISKGMANAKKYPSFGVSSPRLQHRGFVYHELCYPSHNSVVFGCA